jgi:hypothetical protein
VVGVAIVAERFPAARWIAGMLAAGGGRGVVP